jgi:predicted nucleic acid-binding protein
VTQERFSRAWRLRLRYRDKPRISPSDLTSFVVMRELGVRHALTSDAHFEQLGLDFSKLP